MTILSQGADYHEATQFNNMESIALLLKLFHEVLYAKKMFLFILLFFSNSINQPINGFAP